MAEGGDSDALLLLDEGAGYPDLAAHPAARDLAPDAHAPDLPGADLPSPGDLRPRGHRRGFVHLTPSPGSPPRPDPASPCRARPRPAAGPRTAPPQPATSPGGLASSARPAPCRRSA